MSQLLQFPTPSPSQNSGKKSIFPGQSLISPVEQQFQDAFSQALRNLDPDYGAFQGNVGSGSDEGLGGLLGNDGIDFSGHTQVTDSGDGMGLGGLTASVQRIIAEKIQMIRQEAQIRFEKQPPPVTDQVMEMVDALTIDDIDRLSEEKLYRVVKISYSYAMSLIYDIESSQNEHEIESAEERLRHILAVMFGVVKKRGDEEAAKNMLHFWQHLTPGSRSHRRVEHWIIEIVQIEMVHISVEHTGVSDSDWVEEAIDPEGESEVELETETDILEAAVLADESVHEDVGRIQEAIVGEMKTQDSLSAQRVLAAAGAL